MRYKLLIVIESMQYGGGAERFVSLLTNHLSNKFEIYILTFHDFKNLYKFNAKYYSLKETFNTSLSIRNSLKFKTFVKPITIYKKIISISPDLIISFMEMSNFYTILTKILCRIKTPLIISVRCNPKLVYENDLKHFNSLIKILYRLNCVDKIVSVSKGVSNVLENYYNIKKTKIRTIYNGIEIEEISKKSKKEIKDYKILFNDENLIKFITVGRLCKEKGHRFLIDAFSRVKKEIPNSKLIILGEGPLRNELIMQIRKNLLNNDIILLGLKKNPFKYLKKSDIFVLSSINEGFPNVLIEALACRIPIISTNCTAGPKEILENGKYGLLVKVKDSKDLAEKMVFLAKNKKLMEQYSKLSLERALFFKFEKTLNEWNKLINEYLS